MRALAGSLVFHAFAFGMLMPEFGGEGLAVPPQRRLHGQLVLPSVPEREPVAVVEPDPVPQAPSLKRQVATPLALPRPVATAAVPPEPPSQPPAASLHEAGGVQVVREPAIQNAAVTHEVRESGPDAAGLRQYRVALAGEARKFRRYPDSARREGQTGTAEIRISVIPGTHIAELARSSGHTLLDAAALDMLRQAAVRTRLPESLQGRQFAVVLPVVFEVED